MIAESGKQIRQMGFCEISPQFPKTPEESFGDICSQFYSEVLKIGKKALNTKNVRTELIFENSEKPRLCDVQIPWMFVPLLDRYIKRRKKGLRTAIPLGDDIFDDSNDDAFTDDSKVSKAYREWSQKIHDNWGWFNESVVPKSEMVKPSPIGKVVRITTEDQRRIIFCFSNDEELLKSAVHKDFPLCLPHHLNYKHTLTSIASFKNEKLVFLWDEEPNGMIFPDIRGSKEHIYPWWVNNMETETGEKLKNEDAWSEYLKRIKNKEPVTSGRTFKKVLQTEKMAKDNLERWQNYIFYKNPQVFQFRLKPFKSEIGYRYSGKWGYFVSNNPTTHKNLSLEETQEMIQKYKPF